MSRWSAETQNRARAIVAQYPECRSAVMPLLYLAMLEEGHVSNEGMREVAEWTGLTPAQVQAVASFYTMFKRRAPGRYLISLCASISCHLLGAAEVLAAIEEETGVVAGETGDDGLFGVERVECIGACGGAVALQVNYELVEGVTPDKARELCRWLREEQPEVIRSDVLQERFGGQRSFEWGAGEKEGSVAPVPGFGPYGSAAGEPV